MSLKPRQAATLFHLIHQHAPKGSNANERISADLTAFEQRAMIPPKDNSSKHNDYECTVDANTYLTVLEAARADGILASDIESTLGITKMNDGGIHVDMRIVGPIIDAVDMSCTIRMSLGRL